MMAALIRDASAGFCMDEEIDLFQSADDKHESDSEDDDDADDHKQHPDTRRRLNGMAGGESGSAQSSSLAAMLEGTSSPEAQSDFLPPVGRVSSQAMCVSASNNAKVPRQYAQSMGACCMHASSVPVDIPFLSGNHDALHFTSRLEEPDEFIPPHQLSQRHPLMLSLRGESPTSPYKRERLKARDAILKLTGFVERGASKTNLPAMAAGGAAADSQRLSAAPRSSYEPLGGLSQALSFSRPSPRRA